MGLDLTLLPCAHVDEHWGMSHEMLSLDRNPEIFEIIRSLQSEPVPPDFSTFMASDKEGEHCYGDTQQTRYGEPLLMTRMKHLKTVGIGGPAGAFIAASPDEQRVALFWH
jgi:hypothetical protein